MGHVISHIRGITMVNKDNKIVFSDKAISIFLRTQTLTLAMLLMVASIVMTYVYVLEISDNSANDDSISGAQRYLEALTSFRTLYTSEVINTITDAEGDALTITHNYKNIINAIPLPITLTMALGDEIGKFQSGAKTALYSPFPFPWRKQESKKIFDDPFAKEAWASLVQEPHTHYYRFEEINDTKYIRYAVADLMRPSCIDCHNNHPDTPKNDWQVGDVRGIIEVLLPVSIAKEKQQSSLQKTFMVLSSFLLVIFCILFLFIARIKQSEQYLKKSNAQLVNQGEMLTMANIEVEASQKKLSNYATELEGKVALRTKQLQEHQQQLIQSEKFASLGVLAAGVAHEINNPTAFVKSNMQVLTEYMTSIQLIMQNYNALEENIIKSNDLGLIKTLERVQQLKSTHNIDYILSDVNSLLLDSSSGLDRIIRIVQDLKRVSYVGSNELTKVDLNSDVIESALHLVRNELKFKCSLTTSFAKLPLYACCPNELGQVIINLLMNAGDAITEKGEINITSEVNKANIIISITDNGTGIADENITKIFDPFFTTKGLGIGTGLGLSISNGIIKKHGGTLSVSSQSGQGSTFTIILPLTFSI